METSKFTKSHLRVVIILAVVSTSGGCDLVGCAADSAAAAGSFAVQTVKLAAHVATFKKYDPYSDTGVPFPFYGNWCGPGYPPEGENPQPIDKVDAACRTHDKCYASTPRNTCACDEALVKSLRSMRNNLTEKQEKSARLIENYFVLSACYGYKSIRTSTSRIDQGTGHVGVACK